jgi:hypothetical protein
VIDGTPHHLEGIEWADWDAAGRLLVATTDGWLQAREGDPVRPDVAFEGRPRRPQPGPGTSAGQRFTLVAPKSAVATALGRV